MAHTSVCLAGDFILRIFQVDGFTDIPFTGNPATVILDAEGQSDSQLQTLAREFSHAETAFVLAGNSADHDIRLRFFNSRKEAPFVGHATIAAHAVLLAAGRRGPGICRQYSNAGILDVTIRDSTIEFRQTRPQLDAPLPLKTTQRIAAALGITLEELHKNLPTRLARKGSSRLLIPICDPRALNSLTPKYEILVELGREIGTEGFFVFAVNRIDGILSTHSRMFCPALGILEDPVSGNAHSMLAAYLWEHALFESEFECFIGYQGLQMLRPGKVSVRIEIAQGEFLAAQIGGNAVIVSEGVLL